MSSGESVNSADGLFAETSDGPRLLGSRCVTCATPYFPRTSGCHNPDCDNSKIEDAVFGPHGSLWSVTIQSYQPPAPVVTPEPWQPYGVGVVELPEGLRVIGRLLTDDPSSVAVGSDVELVIAPLGKDADGADVISWQFKPL
jgi:uncharacterized OB-fold protein